MLKHLLFSVVTVLMTTTLFADPGQIPVSIPDNTPDVLNPRPHSPVQFIAQGYYDLETNVLSLSFLQSIGLCTVTVTNTNNELYIQAFDSDWGNCQMYLAGTPGMYIVSITTALGTIYSGQFMII